MLTVFKKKIIVGLEFMHKNILVPDLNISRSIKMLKAVGHIYQSCFQAEILQFGNPDFRYSAINT